MKHTKPNRQIIDEASAWFVDFRVGDIDSKAGEEFDVWLRRSPEHIQAYLEIAGTYAELPAIPDAQLDVKTLIAHARSSSEDNVVPLPASRKGGELRSNERRGSESSASPRKRPRERTRPFALAASVLLAVAAATTWLYMQRGVYLTQVGEQRSITLADGSTIDLNARTKIRVTLNNTQRHIDLLEGQALFQVTHDVNRPFTVQSNGITVRAVGTQFDVHRKRSGTVVTVVEGRVAVMQEMPDTISKTERASAAETADSGTANGGSAALLPHRGELILAAGEQLTVTPTATSKPTHANLAVATAWTQRRFVFDNTSLTDVADEFNRYSTRPLIVSTPGLEKFHVSGTYSSTNPESLLRFLRAQPGLNVTETDREIRISSR